MYYNSMNKKLVIILIILLCLYFLYHYFNFSTTEGFWNKDTIDNFIQVSQTNAPSQRYNIDILQKTTNEDEVNYYIKNNKWYWDNDTQNAFLDKVKHSTQVRIDPNASMQSSMLLYPQNAINAMLFWNTKEGDFLLNGGILPNNKKIPNVKNWIKCEPYIEGTHDNFHMRKNIYKTINSGIYDWVNNEDIPKIYNKFEFIDTPCNPCAIFNDTPDYSCKFKINTKSKSWFPTQE